MKVQILNNAKGPQRFWCAIVDNKGKAVMVSKKWLRRADALALAKRLEARQ